MPDQKNSLPKEPSFIIEGSARKAVHEPDTQPRSVKSTPVKKNGRLSQRGMLSVMSLLISLLSLGLSMLAGAWVALGVLSEGLSNQIGISTRILVVGLAYGIGWIVSLFGIRTLGNLILPMIIRVYAWVTLVGICALQIAIITRLFKHAYTFNKFNLYMLMMGAALIALIGLHLIIEKHNLVPFSFPILAISLAHLILIVFHYVFVPLEADKYRYIWGDVFFFLFTGVVSGLMLAHLGIMNGFRNRIDRIFERQNKHFVPPD
jgi:hypothetical protein